ncbi:hypothetical protein JVX90_19965 [Gordonia sp. PDNC005]|uniref:DUF5709 domain-containing protein n=1 Tax=unclassified Gordonia (in: high G+C Gram-positive bacteria) TaxID=2657482 RepID=UPI0019632D64|nr:DUF5709 domain-containing protein [Gordonia sp. PDNC005]QRY62605.1 hypothetical protein JVX90_19965 [Gordonia sp. PDNC005]
MSSRDDFDGEYDLDESDQLQPEDTLDDAEVGDILDRGYSPPDYAPGNHEHETLDSRLAEEEPDLAANDDDADPDYPEQAECGNSRAGRIVASDIAGDSDVFGRDAGVDGAGASAEEAAMHIID